MSAKNRMRHQHEFDRVVAYINQVPSGHAYLTPAILNDITPAGNPKERQQFSDRLAALGHAHGIAFKRELKKTVTVRNSHDGPTKDRHIYHYRVFKA